MKYIKALLCSFLVILIITINAKSEPPCPLNNRNLCEERHVFLGENGTVMVAFKSIIVFDSETTSLPKIDHNTTKITELAFLGCEVEHLKNCHELPRVLHKLVLLFNPTKPIHPESSKVSGLSNELLMNVKPFREEDVYILREFINRLPSPVCIVAHNGDKFDFPILRRAIEKVDKELQNNVYCADSVKAFRSLLSGNINNSQSSLWTRRPQISDNAVTPKRQGTQPVNSLQYKNVARELFLEEEDLADWTVGQESSNSHPCNPPLKSYKLRDIYHFYFGGYFADAHRAEEDSKALLSCIIRCEGFLNWINENAVVFNSVQPLF